MLLVRKMNLDEREEGEITEYEDISSDEEILLRQRIAEIEQLASLSNKGKHMTTTTRNYCFNPASLLQWTKRRTQMAERRVQPRK